MKKQVLLIHGGDTFKSYEEYLDFLKNHEFDKEMMDKMRDLRWKDLLERDLGKDFKVIYPKMPCKWNAKYLEWKIWFEKFIPYITESVDLVGHSLGGVFLVKYLSENKFPVKIKSLHLVAAPFEDNNDDSGQTEKYNLCDFGFGSDLSGIVEQVNDIFLYHSEDDPVVPFSDLEKYLEKLPLAKKFIFKDREHFSQDKFPELVENIKKA